jgi:hypothetical protein
MSKTLTEILQELPQERRKKVADRCADLTYQELNNQTQQNNPHTDSSAFPNSTITLELPSQCYYLLIKLALLEEEILTRIIEKSLFLYLSYQDTLGEIVTTNITSDSCRDQERMLTVTLALPIFLQEKLIRWTEQYHQPIASLLHEALEFYEQKSIRFEQNPTDKNANSESLSASLGFAH